MKKKLELIPTKVPFQLSVGSLYQIISGENLYVQSRTIVGSLIYTSSPSQIKLYLYPDVLMYLETVEESQEDVPSSVTVWFLDPDGERVCIWAVDECDARDWLSERLERKVSSL